MTLTARVVETARPAEKPYKLADGQGLYLFVSPAGGKSWRANYTHAGKQRTRTYGRWPAMSLADARRAHAEARDGPQAPTAAPSPTFRSVARLWLVKHQAGLSNAKHRGQVEATLERFAYPTLGDRPLAEIRRADLVAVVQAVGDRVETAHRVAGRITAVFDHALDVGILEAHPAASLSRVLEPRSQ